MDGTSDGLTALWMAAQKKYGLIMTEMAMAPVAGLDILNTIRADRLLKATKVMMMTGEGRPGDEAKARAAGANGFILKPFQREALQQAIADLTSSTFSGEVAPVHRRQCVTQRDENLFHASGIGSRRL